MEQVLKLAENYVIKRVMSNHAPLTHANKITMVLPLLISILIALAMTLCLCGLYVWLLTIGPMHNALLILGAVFFMISLVFIIALIVFNRIKERKIKRARQQFVNDITLGFHALDSELSKIEFIQKNPKICASLATILGYITSNKLKE